MRWLHRWWIHATFKDLELICDNRVVVGIGGNSVQPCRALNLSDLPLRDLLKSNIPALADFVMTESEQLRPGTVEFSWLLTGVLNQSLIVENLIVNSRPIIESTFGACLTRFHSANLYIGDVNVQALAVVAWMSIGVVKVHLRMRFTWRTIIFLKAIATSFSFLDKL